MRSAVERHPNRLLLVGGQGVERIASGDRLVGAMRPDAVAAPLPSLTSARMPPILAEAIDLVVVVADDALSEAVPIGRPAMRQAVADP